MIPALVYMGCLSVSGLYLNMEPIEKEPSVEPLNAAPEYDPDYDPNNYFPDCEDWEEVES